MQTILMRELSFSSVTENRVVEFNQEVSAGWQYEANVTNITHAMYGYTPNMDVETPDFFSL
jgi:hypothetical protein